MSVFNSLRPAYAGPLCSLTFGRVVSSPRQVAVPYMSALCQPYVLPHAGPTASLTFGSLAETGCSALYVALYVGLMCLPMRGPCVSLTLGGSSPRRDRLQCLIRLPMRQLVCVPYMEAHLHATAGARKAAEPPLRRALACFYVCLIRQPDVSALHGSALTRNRRSTQGSRAAAAAPWPAYSLLIRQPDVSALRRTYTQPQEHARQPSRRCGAPWPAYVCLIRQPYVSALHGSARLRNRRSTPGSRAAAAAALACDTARDAAWEALGFRVSVVA